MLLSSPVQRLICETPLHSTTCFELLLQAVLDLSKEQVQDLMFLRRVYFLRRHELQTQRAALRNRAEALEAEPMYATSRMANVNRQLNHNGIEDIQTMLRFSWTMYLGVCFQILQHFATQAMQLYTPETLPATTPHSTHLFEKSDRDSDDDL